MSSDVRTFRAPTMQAALEIVRQEMGLEAVILHTRHLTLKRFLPWGRPKEEVEITAGLGVNVRPLAARTRAETENAASNVAAAASVGGKPRESRTPVAAAAIAEPSKRRRWPKEDEVSEYDRPATREALSRDTARDNTSRETSSRTKKLDGVEFAFSTSNTTSSAPNNAPRRVAGSDGNGAANATPVPAPSPVLGNRPPARRPQQQPTTRMNVPSGPSAKPSDPATRRDAAARRAEAKPQPQNAPAPAPRAPLPPRPAPMISREVAQLAVAAAAADPSSAFAERLDSIERMLEQLGKRVKAPGSDDIPPELFELYSQLIDRDVEDGLARGLVYRMKEHCSPAQLADPHACRSVLGAMVESELRCSKPIAPPRGRRTVVALVGATGVGKTTTIAKLAAHYRLRDGLKMGLVTVDTYRIAAVDQLRTYAEIIDLPMRVVTNPREMRLALDELTGLDLVLIDTAGRSPRDEVQIQELKQLLAEADVDQVHLVLSMTASLRSLETTVEKFAPIKPHSVILSKLDEAQGLGAILSLSNRYKIPVSYVTTGQDVPDDFEPATPALLADLVLGDEAVGSGQ